MCKFIIVGNWKMNKIVFEVKEFVEVVKNKIFLNDKVDLVIGFFVLFL